MSKICSAFRNVIVFMSQRVRFAFVLLLISILIYSCTKENELEEIPVIKFLKDTACIANDTSVFMGSAMKYRIQITGEKSPITNFFVKFNNGTEQYFLDTGIYSKNFIFELVVQKGAAALETWTFGCMNKDRQVSLVSVNVGLAAGGIFGNVKSHDIILGAQLNTQHGSFFSFSEDTVFDLEGGFNNQSVIDMAYCFYPTYESTLSSPNDNDASTVFTGTYGISNWQLKNEARYNLTMLTQTDFDNVQNDSLLLASYDIIDAKRKGKNIVPGQVWAFRIQSGRIGLIYIENTLPGESGTVELRIKIQE